MSHYADRDDPDHEGEETKSLDKVISALCKCRYVVCSGCPYRREGNCKEQLLDDAADWLALYRQEVEQKR